MMNDRIIMVTIAGFQIRSVDDAQYFLDHCMGVGVLEFDDLNDQACYYALRKESNGRILIGHARGGADPLTAEPILMSDENVAKRLYYARKSINKRIRRRSKGGNQW